MSEYMFGVSRQKPTRKAAKVMEQIAKRHGAGLIEARIPGTGYQRWFAGPNLGHPFDSAMSKAVYEELVKAGILLASECASFLVLLIDEPEAFLHPPQARRLAAALARTAKSLGRQVILATHSTDIIQGALSCAGKEFTGSTSHRARGPRN